MRRRLIAGAAGAVIVLAGIVGGYYLHVRHESRDIVGSSTVEFVSTQSVTALKHATPPDIPWPMYGLDAAHQRVAVGSEVAPPFRKAWTFKAQSYIEFPPVEGYGRLYFANNAGVVFAISAKTGKRAWKYHSGRCQAMSPAVSGNTVYVTFLNGPPCNSTRANLGGELVALWAGSGKVRWLERMDPSESSPTVSKGVVYVGDWGGRVSCFSATTGKLYWRFQADGKVKGAIALSGNRVYFGTYDSKVYALNARNGKLIWDSSAQSRLGHAGEFYSTPAVAYDRVYIGATDGKVYSFGASTGDLRWSQSTGGYVYASPAVWKEKVYAGSYSGTFYAFDAATGRVLWTFHADGRISGSATIVAGRVYFSTLNHETYALDATTGRQLWSYPDGEYSPVIADAHRLYLVGRARIYGLDPAPR